MFVLTAISKFLTESDGKKSKWKDESEHDDVGCRMTDAHLVSDCPFIGKTLSLAQVLLTAILKLYIRHFSMNHIIIRILSKTKKWKLVEVIN